MDAFIKFNRGIMQMPVRWRLWLALLITANLIVPVFFIGHLEAQVVIGALLGSMVLMTILTGLTGFTRLLGLGHIFWIPLVYFLWTRLPETPVNGGFGTWMRVLITLNAASLVIDAVDVIRYIRGDREETIKHAPEGSSA